ncbi:MAG: hypothetical protein EA426_20435 [Spirochaetaceae bacterium]|nr:MAG: hypothetical protein EA426_20435 [Spirochaetaceae bacterium]
MTLANRVLGLTEPASADDVENACDSELRARIQAHDEGRSQTKSAAEIFQDLDAKLPS